MFCYKCGNKIKEENLFCTNCGTKKDVEIPTQPQKQQATTQPSHEHNSFKPITQDTTKTNFAVDKTVQDKSIIRNKRVIMLGIALLAVIVFGASFFVINNGGSSIRIAEVVPPQFDEVMNFSEGRAAVRVGRQWGFIDTTGREIVPPQFTEVRSFSEGLAFVALRDNALPHYDNRRWGVIDLDGNEVVGHQFDWVNDFSEGLAAVRSGGYRQWSFIDTNGREVLSLYYDYVRYLSNGRAVVGIGFAGNREYGFIDRDGREIVAPRYDSVRSFCDTGLAAVRVGSRTEWRDGTPHRGTMFWGFIDSNGIEVLPPQFSEVRPFHNGFAAVRSHYQFADSSGWGFINTSGRLVIPHQYSEVWNFTEDGFAIVQHGHWQNSNVRPGIINREGIYTMEPRQLIQLGGAVSEGLITMRQDTQSGNRINYGLFGFSDTSGRQIIRPEYMSAQRFSEGLAAVSVRTRAGDANSDRWGFINTSGEMVISPQWGLVLPFNNGMAAVRTGVMGGQWGLIDTRGREIITPQFDELRPFVEGLAAVRIGNQWGFISVGN